MSSENQSPNINEDTKNSGQGYRKSELHGRTPLWEVTNTVAKAIDHNAPRPVRDARRALSSMANTGRIEKISEELEIAKREQAEIEERERERDEAKKKIDAANRTPGFGPPLKKGPNTQEEVEKKYDPSEHTTFSGRTWQHASEILRTIDSMDRSQLAYLEQTMRNYNVDRMFADVIAARREEVDKKQNTTKG